MIVEGDDNRVGGRGVLEYMMMIDGDGDGRGGVIDRSVICNDEEADETKRWVGRKGSNGVGLEVVHLAGR